MACVARLDDDARTLVFGVPLEESLPYTHSLPGSRDLKALVVFDEAYGLLPPQPANPPPIKRPTAVLMKGAPSASVSSSRPRLSSPIERRLLGSRAFADRYGSRARRRWPRQCRRSGQLRGRDPALIGSWGSAWFWFGMCARADARPAVVAGPSVLPGRSRPRWATSFLRGLTTLGIFGGSTGAIARYHDVC